MRPRGFALSTIGISPARKALGGCVALAALAANQALAQTQLPGIVVTTPSPVARPAPASGGLPRPRPSRRPFRRPASSWRTFSPPSPWSPSQDIVATPGANLDRLAADRPGIAGSTFAPGANRPVIRGLDNYRVRVQENGIGSHDVSALSEDHAVPIDPFAADQIEVVRGPATLRYGSQAIGGVVERQQRPHPRVHPAERLHRRDARAASARSTTAPTAPSR